MNFSRENRLKHFVVAFAAVLSLPLAAQTQAPPMNSSEEMSSAGRRDQARSRVRSAETLDRDAAKAREDAAREPDGATAFAHEREAQLSEQGAEILRQEARELLNQDINSNGSGGDANSGNSSAQQE